MTRSEEYVGQGDRQSSNGAEAIALLLYTFGPLAIVAGALVVVGLLVKDDGPWMGFRGFTAFWIPVIVGSYVLRRWPEWLRSHVKADDRHLTLIVPFFVVLLVGGALLTGDSGVGRWILGLGVLGLLIAVLFIVRIVDRPSHARTSGHINMAALDIIVATVVASGVLVLFKG